MLFFLCLSSCCFTSLTHPLLYNTKTGLNKQYGHKMEKPTALREEGALCSNRLVAHIFLGACFFRTCANQPADGQKKVIKVQPHLQVVIAGKRRVFAVGERGSGS
jgi:hypothetical protein